MITEQQIRCEFIEVAIIQAEAIFRGDSKLANRCHAKLQKFYDKAKAEQKLHLFGSLLGHENENVRLTSAVFYLAYDEDVAIAVLKGITNSPTIFSVTAKTILELWEKDLLNLL